MSNEKQSSQVQSEPSLMESIKWMKDKIDKLESDNERIKRENKPKSRKFSIIGAANAPVSEFEESMEERDRYVETHPDPVLLVKESGFKGKQDCCPWCTLKHKESLIDQNKMGRWQCRTCGKAWHSSHLGQPWSLEMERDYDGHLRYDEPSNKYVKIEA